MTFRSWMHYRTLSQLLKAMRGRILRITFPQRPQTFGLRGLKVLHEGYLKAQERKYLVPIFLVKIIIIYNSDGEIIRTNCLCSNNNNSNLVINIHKEYNWQI